MELSPLSLPGLILITPTVYEDNRGFFYESYKKALYLEKGIGEFVQENCSFSKKGVLRGMHFQKEPGQAKLISVLQGEIYDVAVDIRPESSTFLQWEGVRLEESSPQQLYIPVGFAHGFCVLSERALVQYKVSSLYDPKTEKGFRFDDPEVGITWPIKNPILSERDKKSPYCKELFSCLGR